MGFLEVIGVASILPFMQLMAEPDAIQKSTWLTAAYEYFNFSSHRQMLIYSGVSIIVLIGITNAFGILTIYLQYKFSWDIAHNLSTRLLKNYINKPYDFYLKTNTSSLQTYITIEVGSLTGGVIVPVIEFVSRLFVSAVIFMMLMMVDLKVALVMFGCLGSAYILIYYSQKNYLKKIGKYRLEMNKLRFKSIKELFSGIKTIMVHNKKDFFYDRFDHASKEFCSIQPTYNLLLATPRSVLEFLAFGSILSITIYLYISSGNIQSTIPRLSLYAVAGYRLLPALQKVFSSIAKLRYNFPIVNRLHEDLQFSQQDFSKKPKAHSIPFEHHLELNALQFSYDDSKENVIEHLTISISKGETVAFIGSTGSGKTTLVDIIVGLLNPDNGTIKLDGTPLSKSNLEAWQKHLAYVPQEVFLFDDTVKSNITFGCKPAEIDVAKLERAARLAGVHDFISSKLPKGYDTKIGERGIRLSGGQRQRLGLARALYRLPSVLILDEATSALDSITENSIIESLKVLPNDITTIIIAHRLSTVKHADCIYLIDEGKITAKGSYDALVHSSKSFKTMVNLS